MQRNLTLAIFLLLSIPLISQEKIISKLKNFSVTVPRGMTKVNDLNPRMHVQAADYKKVLFITILSTPKSFLADDPITLDQYHTMNLSEIMKVKGVKKTIKNEKTKIIDFDSRTAEFQAVFRDAGELIKINYIMYNIETKVGFYYVLCWTLEEKLEDNRKIVDQVLKSFKELKK